jgi:hypothetical protein
MAFLQGLTDDDRRSLAASSSPLAPFADVQTPQEAMSRVRSPPQGQQMQLMGKFMRVRDKRR